MVLEEVVVDVTSQSQLFNTLTAAALALLSVAPPIQAAQADYADVNSQFSRYEEGGGRMKIDIYQALALLPFTDRLNLKVNGVKDIVTGASPVANTPKLNGKPYQMLSGASIKDERDSVDGTLSYQHENGIVSLGGGRSSENDYESNFFNIDSRLDFNQKMTTFETGYGFSSDKVWAIDHCPPHCLSDNASLSSASSETTLSLDSNSPSTLSETTLSAANSDLSSASLGTTNTATSTTYKRPDVGGDKVTHQGLLGVTQILDKDSLVQANLTYTYNGGYLSDPYKAVYASWATVPYPIYGGTFIHDARPSNRNQIALLTRYVHHFSALNSAAVHIDYRYYVDTWGVNAHTFEATWIQPVWADWKISPTVRYYSQGSADFYQPYFTAQRADGHYSSDYRLAQFGAIGGGVQVSKDFFERLNLGFGIDFYERKNNYGFNGGSGTSVDNFTFSMYTAKINVKF